MTTTGGIEVEIDPLYSDARKWDSERENLHNIGLATRNLKLGSEELTAITSMSGFQEIYEQARVGVSRLLVEASDYFGDIANQLRSTAQQYEHDDISGSEVISRAGEQEI